MAARPSVEPTGATALRQLGLVVHPTRRVDAALGEIEGWASSHGLALGQIRIPGQERAVAEPVEAAACDLLIAVGGDGTALTALHAGAEYSCPVLAVACGSLGVLTSVTVDRLQWALEQVSAGRWTPLNVPGLDLSWDDTHGGVAINDVAIVRDGPGQVIVSVSIDGVLYARVAGDGLVVATALGSSAYTIAAGGPILAPGADGTVVTPLAPHGGFCPPLVAGPESRLAITIEAGYVGVRCELDGRRVPVGGELMLVSRRPEYATLVSLAEEEPRLSGLRRRGIVLDSPRVLVRDNRV
jgi:NAD+ kinase